MNVDGHRVLTPDSRKTVRDALWKDGTVLTLPEEAALAQNLSVTLIRSALVSSRLSLVHNYVGPWLSWAVLFSWSCPFHKDEEVVGGF